MEVVAAAEYYLDHELEEKGEAKDLLTFGEKYILFEVSYLNPPENLNSFVFKLQTNGYIPVLAHPERYPFWYGNREHYKELKEKGVLFQMNINSLSGHYSLETKKIAEWMVEQNLIDFLGSDCHHMRHVELMKQVVYEKMLHQLVDSGKLLNHTL